MNLQLVKNGEQITYMYEVLTEENNNYVNRVIVLISHSFCWNSRSKMWESKIDTFSNYFQDLVQT
jgi:hypothetical protein